MRIPALPPLLLGALAAACAGGSADSAPPPDVLLITLDSVRADDLTFDDPRSSPHLARLAERGTVFTQAIAGSSWTLPSHAEIFTGQPPSLHRVESDDTCIDPLTPTLPELLRRSGWSTAGVWSGWYVAGEYGFARGFDSYENAMTGGEELERRFAALLEEGGAMAQARAAQATRERASHADVTSPRVAELAGLAAERCPPGERLFVFAHFFDPHYDYVPPGEWATRFDPGYEGTIDGHNYWANPRIWDEAGQRRVVSDRDLAHLRALYRGEIGWTDESIGALLARLERSGRLENTLVVVTADHGEEFFEHGRRGHKQSLFDEVLRVPLLIVLPERLRGRAPARVGAQVSLSDILPTLLDYAGVPVPEAVHGRSLRPALEGRPFASRPLVSSLQLYSAGAGGEWKVFLHEALRTPAYKLQRITEVAPGSPPRLTFLGLCELARDPDEMQGFGGPASLTQDHPPVRAAWDELEAELALLRRLSAASARAPDDERTTDMARVVASELRGLGYVGEEALGAESPARLLPWGLSVRAPMSLPAR